MINYDLHMHTIYCDGKHTPTEMVLAGIKKGLKFIGISGHCNTNFDKSYCMSEEETKKYYEEIHKLKDRFSTDITVLCGIEQDYYAGKPTMDFDYVIGSVHYVYKDGEYISVDYTEKTFTDAVEKYYNGNFYAFAEDYYDLVGNVAEKTGADIIGHFDLITKFNEGYKLFDEKHPRYVKAYRKAVDRLIPHGKPFEVNTGAISRGYRTEPYPATQILKYIKEKGGKVILSSDSHSAENICFQFDKWEKVISDMGFEL